MHRAAIFRGSEQETIRLLGAVENSCAQPSPCVKDASGRTVQMCAAHRGLLDQRFLDGLLYVRWMYTTHNAKDYIRGEWQLDADLPCAT